MTSDVIVPSDPVWRANADFVIRAQLPDGGVEQLWARRLGETEFSLCCVPFFVYDIALGDTVATDDSFTVRKVVARSGRRVARVWFGDSDESRSATSIQLAEMGALLEWSSVHLLGVDSRDSTIASAVTAYLTDQHNRGRLVFEHGSPSQQ